MKVGRTSAGCKPARFGARVNADATSIGMDAATESLGFRSAGRTAFVSRQAP